ncbi:hypothetical protein [Acidiphilium angustum]|uniref:NADH:quinone oxidoreductase/Mrp antiporter membrane subunit domain-containing protein n=2 Tax=Acidiphilium rubrum TaxID=526 RepID=A0A8G2CIQ7_ACIRU|nr:hypothetical protein [Acidiphilium angustum]SIQ32472.1 hypothetical protein SAMN05421828_103197 [Acidiphilium rubrum]
MAAMPAAVAGGVAGLAFAGALGMAAVALFGLAPMQAALPWFGGAGFDVADFAVDPLRAALLAPLLLAAAATITAAGRPKPGLYALIVASVLAVLALGPYGSALGAVFWGGIALLLALWGRQGGAFALAAVPSVLVTVALDAPALDPVFALAGGAALLGGGLWAARANTLAGLARATALGFAGLALLSLGLGAAPAAVAAMIANALIAPVLGIAAATLTEATGTSALDWLGGIARGMPRFALLMGGGLAFAAMLPPGPGFVAFSAAWRAAIGAGAWTAIVVLALWFALMGFAVLRAFAAIALGRPRSLRAAAAEDAARPVLVALAALLLGGAIFALADPARLGLGLAMAALALGARWFLLRAGPVDVPAYDDGFARSPAWLPFGDPTTQITATGFAGALRLPPRAQPAWRWACRAGRWLAVPFRP